MGLLVFFCARIALLPKQLLFALEMHFGEFHKSFQLSADVAKRTTAEERQAKLIQRFHEDAVLIVHCFNADYALVTPGEQ
jgi:hypothetical protein